MSATTWAKFYWSDWLSDPALARCSLAAQGLWMRLLCIAAKGDPIGFVAMSGQPFNLRDIARLGAVPEAEAEALIGELDRYGVLSRDKHGTIYSRRMVRDSKRAAIARRNGKNGGNPSLRKYDGILPPDNPRLKATDKGRLKTQIPEAREKEPLHGSFSEAGSERLSTATARDGLLNGKPPPRASVRQAVEVPAPAAPPPRVFVAFDTPEWTAWANYRRSIGKTPATPASNHADRTGWWFETRWPPDHPKHSEAA